MNLGKYIIPKFEKNQKLNLKIEFRRLVIPIQDKKQQRTTPSHSLNS